MVPYIAYRGSSIAGEHCKTTGDVAFKQNVRCASNLHSNNHMLWPDDHMSLTCYSAYVTSLARQAGVTSYM
jgi:hypothetical protein